ncbi:methyltransferase family protein [Rubrobacter xylanophilus]|uniref:methyltransferase family protein n=1 Tax=Rubrobacter xylanophilus TaxID=49319 RepID=UPI001C64237D|nr:methyltransferase [Rubrobacter xylanophilus]
MGWPLLVGGALLVRRVFLTMRRADTSFHLDEPASRLLTDGLFRYSRNPAHLSFTMIYTGVSSPCSSCREYCSS